jgi:hypothetical protein
VRLFVFLDELEGESKYGESLFSLFKPRRISVTILKELSLLLIHHSSSKHYSVHVLYLPTLTMTGTKRSDPIKIGSSMKLLAETHSLISPAAMTAASPIASPYLSHRSQPFSTHKAQLPPPASSENPRPAYRKLWGEPKSRSSLRSQPSHRVS